MKNLPTTCIWAYAVAVENSGASAVTSQEKFPESEKFTLRITTCVAFETFSCKVKETTKVIKIVAFKCLKSF